MIIEKSTTPLENELYISIILQEYIGGSLPQKDHCSEHDIYIIVFIVEKLDNANSIHRSNQF